MAGRIENLKPFPKGVSGNPSGRPRRAALSEALRNLLDERCPTDEARRTNAEVIAERLVLAALAGSIQAMREIADRSEGKVPIAARNEVTEQQASLAWYDALLREEGERAKREQKRRERRLLAGESVSDPLAVDVSV